MNLYLFFQCKRKLQSYTLQNKLFSKINRQMDELISPSPEEELKSISLDQNVGKNTFDTPRTIKKLNGKFTFESWNISQKLQPVKAIDQHYQSSFSNYYTPSASQSNKFRTKSAYLFQQHDTRQHNFNNKKNYINEPNTQRKSLSLFNTSKLNTTQKSSISMSHENKPTSNKIIFKSKSKLQAKFNSEKEKEQKSKTVEQYLTSQKEILNREKSLIHNQRINKEALTFLVYPTQYWQGIKFNSPQRKRVVQDEQKSSPFSRSAYNNKGQLMKGRESSIEKTTNSKSPIKRFSLFVNSLQKFQKNDNK